MTFKLIVAIYNTKNHPYFTVYHSQNLFKFFKRFKYFQNVENLGNGENVEGFLNKHSNATSKKVGHWPCYLKVNFKSLIEGLQCTVVGVLFLLVEWIFAPPELTLSLNWYTKFSIL